MQSYLILSIAFLFVLIYMPGVFVYGIPLILLAFAAAAVAAYFKKET